jgi:hypothetical protein
VSDAAFCIRSTSGKVHGFMRGYNFAFNPDPVTVKTMCGRIVMRARGDDEPFAEEKLTCDGCRRDWTAAKDAIAAVERAGRAELRRRVASIGGTPSADAPKEP